MEGIVGIPRNLSLFSFNQAFLKSELFFREKHNPYYPIVYDDSDPTVTQELGYLDEVLNTCIELKARELLGLSMTELLSLDRTTFRKIKRKLQEYRKKESEAMTNVDKTLNKNVLGG